MKKLQSVALALCCLALVILLFGAHATFAQTVTATITGTVTDPSGAAVAGATVTAKSVERGETFTGKSGQFLRQPLRFIAFYIHCHALHLSTIYWYHSTMM